VVDGVLNRVLSCGGSLVAGMTPAALEP